MRILKGMKSRLYVTPEQASYLSQVAGCVRLVFNLGLEQRRTYGRRERYFNYEGQRAELKALKAEAEFLRDVPHHPLQEALVDLETAFKRFFTGTSRHPKPRIKGIDDGIRFPDPKQFRIEPTDDKRFVMLHLPKMGKSKGDAGALRMRLHRPLEGEVRSLTLTRTAGIWYVSILCDVEIKDPTVPVGKPIGGDRGVAVPFMGSNGYQPPIPTPTDAQKRRKRRLKKALSRCKPGSNNRRKAKRRLARHEAKETRRRRDALHKVSTHLAKNHCLVVFEDLKVKNMTASAAGTKDKPGRNVAQKAGLNRAILEVGWGTLTQFVRYKTGWYGSTLRLVPPMNSSRECSECRHIDAKSRVTRDWFRCTACGHAEHADLNAAKVVLYRGTHQHPVEGHSFDGSLPSPLH